MIYDVKGLVKESRFLTPKIKFVRVELLGDLPAVRQGFEFKAGQFVNVEVAPNFWRSYSIASPSTNPKLLEYVVDITPGGKGSQFFQKLGINDGVHIKGPFGKLVLPEIMDSDFCFVATGTGIAPFRSMLGELHREKVSLFWGLRFKEDIYWEEEFKNLKKFCISLSRPDILPTGRQGWEGEVGHITECIKRESFNGDTLFYLCGNQSMIDEARRILLGKGVSEEKIVFEKFY